MTGVAMWWERIDRTELDVAIDALLGSGGCLILEGDRLSGRHQAATLAEARMINAGFRVHRIASNRTSWTTVGALNETWRRLQGTPRGYGLSPEAQLAGRPVGSITDELAEMLQNAGILTALIFEDLDRDGSRDYDLARVFRALARQSERPVVATYDPSGSRWPTRADVLPLRDFSRAEVRDCLDASSGIFSCTKEELDAVVDFVFGSPGADNVRPHDAYLRPQAWRAGA